MDVIHSPAPEQRKAMMAIAKVSWQGQDGTVETYPARIEDMSLSGACLRVKFPAEVGTRIFVSWFRGEFSGEARWCTPDNFEYLIGIKRDAQTTPILPAAQAPAPQPSPPPAPRTAQSIAEHRPASDPVPAAPAPAPKRLFPVPTQPAPLPPANRELFFRVPRPIPMSLLPVRFPPAVVHEPMVGFQIASSRSSRDPRGSDSTALPGVMVQTRTSPLLEEMTPMQNKWLNMGSRRPQQDASKGNSSDAPSPRSSSPESVPAGRALLSPSPASPMLGVDPGLATPRGDLLPLDDIYRAAGIVAPRLGYTIIKVLEMLSSDHLRGLSDEIKRASVLMALHAAGVPLNEIIQDAQHRQNAIAKFEADQRRKFEDYWARRAEENTLLQAEMERVTRQYVERMNRNLNEVAQEKEAFQKWQAGLQQEILQISEAVTLCSQASALDPAPEIPAAPAANSTDKDLVAKSA